MTDPFGGVDFNLNISQSTYVEIIYARKQTINQAVVRPNRTVSNSLSDLAFKHNAIVPIRQPGTVHHAISTPQHFKQIISTYNLSPHALQAESQRLNLAASSLRKLLVNEGPQGVMPQSGPVIVPPFDANYSLIDLGPVSNLTGTHIGVGLIFKFDDPNVLLIGDPHGQPNSKIYQAIVTRDPFTHQITSVNPAVISMSAPFAAGGMAYAPNHTLFVAGWSTNYLHQYRPGDSNPRKTIYLGDYGVDSSVSSIGFIPFAIPGSQTATKCLIIGYNADIPYTLELSLTNDGTYDIVTVIKGHTPVHNQAEGFVFTTPGALNFPSGANIILSESTGKQVVTFIVDAGAEPVLSSRKTIVYGLEGVSGAAIDPLTGDFLFFGTYNGSHLYIIRGGFVIPPPPPPPPPSPPPTPTDSPDCGVNTQLVTNPAFSSGTGGWYANSALTIPLSPSLPTYYDSINHAIILDSSGASNTTNQAWQLITVKNVDELLSLSFIVNSFNNNNPPTTTIEVGLTITNGTTLINSITAPAYNGVATPLAYLDPNILANIRNLVGSAPLTNYNVLLFVKIAAPLLGAGSAQVSIRNVSLCEPICAANPTIISTANFNGTLDLWVGGVLGQGTQFGYLLVSKTVSASRLIRGLIIGSIISVKIIKAGGIFISGVSNSVTTTFESPDSELSVVFTDVIGSDGSYNITISGTDAIGNYSFLDQVEISIIHCPSPQPIDCSTGITDLRAYIEWHGAPRHPINIFNLFARLKYRAINDPMSTTIINLLPSSDGRVGLSTPTSCDGNTTADFWKQQGVGGIPSNNIVGNINPNTIDKVEDAVVASVATKTNWLWSVPASIHSSIQDNLVVSFNDPAKGLIESIDIFMLCNEISPSGSNTTPVCNGPFVVTDPATSFDIIIRFKNQAGLDREFRNTINKSLIYQDQADYASVAPKKWDSLTSVGNGLKGTAAGWLESKFVLDTTDGVGLDQCTDPIGGSVGGGGNNLVFPSFKLRGIGKFTAACVASVTVTESQKGSAVNAVQSIILSGPSGGTWTLFTGNNPTNAVAFAWDVTAAQIETELGSLTEIGAGNVTVTGDGTAAHPFIVTFVNDLAARPISLMIGNGDNLLGCVSAVVTTIQDGTRNERQTITAIGEVVPFYVTFNGVRSTIIPWNATLNQMETILEGISTIGAGNVYVTGNITDRNYSYQGPWFIEFIGMLEEQNLPLLTTNPISYFVSNPSQGGIGINEKQLITIEIALGGTFKIIVPTQTTMPDFVTGPLTLDATAAEVAAAIAAAPFFDSGDIYVTIPTNIPSGFKQWVVEFRGAYYGISLPLMSIDGSLLEGGSVTTANVVQGSGVLEKQKLTIWNADGGYFRLRVTIDGVSDTTAPIQWDTTPILIHDRLNALSVFNPGDLSVIALPRTDPNQTAVFEITFKKRFGDVSTLEPIYSGTLTCNPLSLPPVNSGPYDYKLPFCSEIDPDVSFQDGPLLCRPGVNKHPIVPPIAGPLSDIANTANQIVFERDLFDPTRTINNKPITVRDLIIAGGKKPSEYIIYTRNFTTGSLELSSLAAPATNRKSFVLVDRLIDSNSTKEQVRKLLIARRNILPTRMV